VDAPTVERKTRFDPNAVGNTDMPWNVRLGYSDLPDRDVGRTRPLMDTLGVQIRTKDGLRLLVDVGADGRVRIWSRYGASLTDRVGPLAEAFAPASAGSVFDG